MRIRTCRYVRRSSAMYCERCCLQRVRRESGIAAPTRVCSLVKLHWLDAPRFRRDNLFAGCDCVRSHGHLAVMVGAGVRALAPVAFRFIGWSGVRIWNPAPLQTVPCVQDRAVISGFGARLPSGLCASFDSDFIYFDFAVAFHVSPANCIDKIPIVFG